MNLPGLHHTIAKMRSQAAELARQARAPQQCPREGYWMKVEAERLEKESAALAEQAKGNDELMEGVMHLVNYLAQSPPKSRYRASALDALEEAHNWLARENGAAVVELARNFEVLPEMPAVNGQEVS